MTQLQLNQITVRTTRPGATGDDPTPDGTHVLLDVPGGTFDFAHYEVRGGRLQVPASGHSPAVLDTQYRHFCAFGSSPLTAPANQQFQVIPGFGYPLPVRFRQRTMILPNTRDIRVVWYNLTAQTHFVSPGMTAPEIQAAQAQQAHFDNHHDDAARFYRDLHIALDFVPQAAPSGLGLPWVLRGGNALFRSAGPQTPFAPVSPQPDFSDNAWAPAGDRIHTLACFWVEDFQGLGSANGIAWPFLRLLNAIFQRPSQQFRPARTAFLFMRRRSAGGSYHSLAHEIGHCLQSDCGVGKNGIQSTQGHEASVRAFLARLGVEGPAPPGTAQQPAPAPGARLWDELFATVHAPASLAGNLMGTSGGGALLPWQVAVMRASREVGDDP